MRTNHKLYTLSAPIAAGLVYPQRFIVKKVEGFWYWYCYSNSKGGWLFYRKPFARFTEKELTLFANEWTCRFLTETELFSEFL